MVDDLQKLCFEAGIKIGGLYHQFIGTPISEEDVDELETIIEKSVGSQRFVENVEVDIDKISSNRYGYTEIEGTMLNVVIKVTNQNNSVVVSMSEENEYPMMKIDEVISQEK